MTTRDPARYGDLVLPASKPHKRASARLIAAHACGWLSAAALACAVLGAVLAPLSLVPQLSFAVAVVAMLAGCVVGEVR